MSYSPPVPKPLPAVVKPKPLKPVPVTVIDKSGFARKYIKRTP